MSIPTTWYTSFDLGPHSACRRLLRNRQTLELRGMGRPKLEQLSITSLGHTGPIAQRSPTLWGAQIPCAHL